MKKDYVILSPHAALRVNSAKDPYPGKRILRSFRSFRMTKESGLGLVETLLAVAILGTCVVAFAGGLSAGSMASNEQRREVVAQELAQNELEYVKGATFAPGAGTYPSVSCPPGYALNVAVGAVSGADANMQKITVTVLQNGQSVLTLADYKVNR